MNIHEFVKAHKDCPLSIFLMYCEDQLRRESSIIGKAFFNAVLSIV